MEPMQMAWCERGGTAVEFSDTSDYKLVSIDGLSAAVYQVDTSPNAAIDGETYSGATALRRNVVITADILDDFAAKKSELFRFFAPRSAGVLYYRETGSDVKCAEYWVESVTPEFSGAVRAVVISLICPDPLFRDVEDTARQMAGWEPLLKFPFTYNFSTPVMVSRRINNQILTIDNDTGVETGLVIRFSARGAASRPKFQNMTTGKKFELPVDLGPGQWIEATTEQGKKKVTADDETLFEPIPLWRAGDDWVQLTSGENVLRYDAVSGAENLDVTVSYRRKYWGA